MNRRLAKLEERKKALLADSRKILDAAETDAREITPEEKATLDKNDADLTAAQEGIDREHRLAEHERSLGQQKAAGPPDRWPGQIGQIGDAKPAWMEDPNKGFKTPREFLMCVMDAQRRGEIRDERLVYLSGSRVKFFATAGSDEQGGYSDPYGGFLVPTGISPTFLAITPEADPIGGRTTKVPMTAPQVSFNARVDKTHTTSVSGGLVVRRRIETQSQAATRMEFEQVTLTADSLYGLAYATEELLTDSPISFIALLEAGFRDQFTSHLINERLNGTDVGEYMGVNNSPCLISVDKETGQDADSVLYENVIKMRSRCWRYANAVWIYNHDVLPQLMQMVMVIGTSGVPVWQTSAREGEPDMLLGRPAFPSEYANTVGDAGDILLGVWSEYLEGVYQALQSAESIHVRFVENERAFRFTMRCGGAPWWRTYLTPKKSAATLSPFVRLAVRA